MEKEKSRLGAASRRYFRRALRDAAYSALDSHDDDRVADHRRISDSIHGARRVGSCASAFERTIATEISRENGHDDS